MGRHLNRKAIRRVFRNPVPAFIIIATLTTLSTANAQTGLPWESSFETGDFSEWNGFQRGDIVLSSETPADGNWATRIPLVANTLNDNYLEHYFGDHVRTGLGKVDEIYLEFRSKFDAGYTWPNRQSHKLALINLTDGVVSQRRYQVYVFVNSDGEYSVDYSDIDDWLFYGLPQNIGDPVIVSFGQWDKIKLFVRQNSPGNADGVVRMWINDELKAEHSELVLREDSNFGMNKLILSSYTSNSSGGSGVQWSDAWRLSETDFDDVVRPLPPVITD